MRRGHSFGNATMPATLVALAALGGVLLGQSAASQPAQAQQAATAAVPKPIEPPAPFVPEGFTAIFNGQPTTDNGQPTTDGEQ